MKNEKAIFWIRFAIWTIFCCVLPVVFIGWRFELFSGSKVSFSGFGMLAIIIVAIFLISLINYARKGLPYSMFSQCVKGFCKITLPLLAILGAMWCVRNSIDNLLKVLGFVVISETIAIPVNPMPKWVNDNIKEEDQKKYSNMSDIFLEKLFSRGKENND